MGRIAIGFVLSFLIGAGCRYFNTPAASPPVIPGALIVLAMTLGYTSMDKVLIRKKDHGAPTKHLCGGPTLFPRALPGRRGRLRQRARRGRDRPMTKTSSPGQINLE